MQLSYLVIFLINAPHLAMAVDKGIFRNVNHIQALRSLDGVFIDGRTLTGNKLTTPIFCAFYISESKPVKLKDKIKEIIRGEEFLSSLSNEKIEDEILIESEKYLLLLGENHSPLGLLSVRGGNIIFSSVIQVGKGVFQNDPNNSIELITSQNPFKGVENIPREDAPP